MEKRIRKKRNRWLRGLRILIYMNTKKNKKKVHWLSFTRIMILTWSAGMLLYHILWIGMTEFNGIIQHIIGMVVEYLISGIYENSIVRMNKIINKKTMKSSYRKAKRIFFKYIAFGLIFSLTYNVVYIIRILIIYLIDLDMLSWTQAHIAIVNELLFCVVIGPIIGMIVAYTRDKKFKMKIQKKTKNLEKTSE